MNYNSKVSLDQVRSDLSSKTIDSLVIFHSIDGSVVSYNLIFINNSLHWANSPKITHQSPPVFCRQWDRYPTSLSQTSFLISTLHTNYLFKIQFSKRLIGPIYFDSGCVGDTVVQIEIEINFNIQPFPLDLLSCNFLLFIYFLFISFH